GVVVLFFGGAASLALRRLRLVIARAGALPVQHDLQAHRRDDVAVHGASDRRGAGVRILTDASYGGIIDVYNGQGPWYAERAFWPMQGKDIQRTGYNAPTAPNRPTGVTKTVTNGSLRISWNDNSQFETGFVVEKSTDGSAFS